MNYFFDINIYIGFYKKSWKQMTKVAFCCMFLIMLLTWFSPVKYISTATLLLPGSGGSLKVLSGFLGLSGVSTGGSLKDTIISILNSRRMAEDIEKQFQLSKRKKIRYSIEVAEVKGGLSLIARGNDGKLIRDILQFCIKNLDSINSELDITPNKPIVKVLDPPSKERKESKNTLRKMIISTFMVFVFYNLYFLYGYNKKQKSTKVL